MDTWAAGQSTTTVAGLLESLDTPLRQADGVTISGGEPFDQPLALRSLLTGIRDRTEADILVYTGHSLESLESAIKTFEGLIDCLIADPFERDTPQTLVLRGSDNQRMHCLTPLGRRRFAGLDRSLGPGDRVLDVMFDDEMSEAFLVGIPRPGDMVRLASLLTGAHHQAVTTEDRRPAR
jgi:anaerobic ribonucleoside-triphosphate reductase activating protein